jgi:hypothetical protein
VQDRGLYTCKGEGYTRVKTEGYARARQRAIHMQDRGLYTCKAEDYSRARQRSIHVQRQRAIHVQGRGLYKCRAEDYTCARLWGYLYTWSVGKEPIAMFEFTTWHNGFADFFVSLRHYTVIGK